MEAIPDAIEQGLCKTSQYKNFTMATNFRFAEKVIN